MEFGFKPSAQQ